MKTVIHVLSVHTLVNNPFVQILDTGITSDSFRVDTCTKSFWDRKKRYDIIQIHWPEFLLYNKNNNFPTKEFGELLYETLHLWKKSGTKIVFTRHDETTHYVKNKDFRTNLFEIVETGADAIVHLGNFSKNQMVKCNAENSQLHVVIPHHIYDTIYHRSISKEEARKVLDIHEKFKVILCFGKFRDAEEQLLVKNAFEQFNESEKYLFAPSWYHTNWRVHENHIKPAGQSWLGQGKVDKNMLPYCFAAADVVFIQRLRNLNSGNLFMGFLFNKTVVGPAIGNITEYLDNIHNFSFDPFDPTSVVLALEKGMKRSLFPQVNESYARSHLNTAIICEHYRKLYQQLVL